MTGISLLGSSGSIGTQVKQIVRRHPDDFCLCTICVNSSIDAVLQDIAEFRPRLVGVSDPIAAKRLSNADLCGATLVTGPDAPTVCASCAEADVVVLAVVGLVGLSAAIAAIESGHRLAIANKETLIAGGELVMRLARERGTDVYPVDSEHSAIWQCLHAGEHADVRRLILTASGGPFRGKTRAELADVTPAQALAHPTWRMGPKVTIDSATLFNKGLELIEAYRLFGIETIDCVVQPTSVVHSMVEFVDGSVIAQMSRPTMELPIQLALTYPHRLDTAVTPLDFRAQWSIAFEPIDEDTFPAVRLARRALSLGGIAPAVFCAAIEAADTLFCKGSIPFLKIAELVEESLGTVPDAPLTVEGILDVDATVKRRLISAYGRS